MAINAYGESTTPAKKKAPKQEWDTTAPPGTFKFNGPPPIQRPGYTDPSEAPRRPQSIYDDPSEIAWMQGKPKPSGMGQIRMADEARLQPAAPAPAPAPSLLDPKNDAQMMREYQAMGPNPAVAQKAATDGRRVQAMGADYQANQNSRRAVLHKLAPNADHNLIDTNFNLREESRMANQINQPSTVVKSAGENAKTYMGSDAHMYEEAKNRLAALPPDSPERATYERVANTYRQKLTGMTPERDAGTALSFGNPVYAAAGFAESQAGYQAQGERAVGSQERARDSDELRREALQEMYAKQYNSRKAGEQFASDTTNAGRDIERARWDTGLKELGAMGKESAARGRLADFDSSDGSLSMLEKKRQAELEIELTKLEREKRAFGGGAGTLPEDATNFAAQSMAARQRYGITEGAQADAAEALRRISGAVSSTTNGRIVGNFWGGVDDQLRDADAVLSFATKLKSMADAGNRETAASIADEVFRSLPRTNAEGQYDTGASTGDLGEFGSAIAGGAGAGAGAGALIGGVGAIPGAALGATAGFGAGALRIATKAFNESDQKAMAEKLNQARALLESLRQQ